MVLFSASYKKQDAQALLDALDKSQAVIHFNLDGTILWANDNFLNAVGYSFAEIQNKHHSLFVEPAYAQSDEYRNFWKSLREGSFQAAEYKRLGKGGREIWIQASYNPILDKNGKPCKVVKYATDITRQTLQNADLKGQIDAIGKSQAVIHFNLDGTIIWANENFLAAVGYALSEIQGKHHSLFVEPKYIARASNINISGTRCAKGNFRQRNTNVSAKAARTSGSRHPIILSSIRTAKRSKL